MSIRLQLAALCHRAVPPSMSHVTSFSPLRNSDMFPGAMWQYGAP